MADQNQVQVALFKWLCCRCTRRNLGRPAASQTPPTDLRTPRCDRCMATRCDECVLLTTPTHTGLATAISSNNAKKEFLGIPWRCPASFRYQPGDHVVASACNTTNPAGTSWCNGCKTTVLDVDYKPDQPPDYSHPPVLQRSQPLQHQNTISSKRSTSTLRGVTLQLSNMSLRSAKSIGKTMSRTFNFHRRKKREEPQHDATNPFGLAFTTGFGAGAGAQPLKDFVPISDAQAGRSRLLPDNQALEVMAIVPAGDSIPQYTLRDNYPANIVRCLPEPGPLRKLDASAVGHDGTAVSFVARIGRRCCCCRQVTLFPAPSFSAGHHVNLVQQFEQRQHCHSGGGARDFNAEGRDLLVPGRYGNLACACPALEHVAGVCECRDVFMLTRPTTFTGEQLQKCMPVPTRWVCCRCQGVHRISLKEGRDFGMERCECSGSPHRRCYTCGILDEGFSVNVDHLDLDL